MVRIHSLRISKFSVISPKNLSNLNHQPSIRPVSQLSTFLKAWGESTCSRTEQSLPEFQYASCTRILAAMIDFKHRRRARKMLEWNFSLAYDESLEHILRALSSCSLPGFSTTATDGKRIWLHSMICSYMADITEAEYRFEVKRRNMTNISYFWCFSKKYHFALSSFWEKWTLKLTIDLLK